MQDCDMFVLFKKAGIKNTHQRQSVYAYLEAQKGPVTAEKIFLALVDTPLNLSTVYRILETFMKHDLVTKTNIGADSKATYELKSEEHKHHLVCVKCNAIVPIEGCPLKGYEEQLKNDTSFYIIEHKLEIKGICPKCQKH